MEKPHSSVRPEKSTSFRERAEENRVNPPPSRTLSMNYVRSGVQFGGGGIEDNDGGMVAGGHRPDKILEEDPTREPESLDDPEEQKVVDSGDVAAEAKNEGGGQDSRRRQDLVAVDGEIDAFLKANTVVVSDQVPFSVVERFAVLVGEEVNKIEGGEDQPSKQLAVEGRDGETLSLVEAIGKLSKLTAMLAELPSEQQRDRAFNLADVVLREAMAFLELEFKLLLEYPKPDEGTVCACAWSPPLPADGTVDYAENDVVIDDHHGQKPLYPKEVIDKLQRIAETMISAGYERECYRVFGAYRRWSLEAALAEAGFEKMSIDDIQKMSWENLEGEITKWNAAFKRYVSISYSLERELWRAVFSTQPPPAAAAAVFVDLSCRVLSQLLNFAEAVSMTKRSAEKLFKLLDMYETLRDFSPKVEEGDADHDGRSSELVMEQSEVRSRLGEAAVRIFTELEKSIKSDTAKTTVPGGAVHPLTRYVVNYVKYVCEYKDTLTQLFEDHHRRTATSETCSSPTPPGDHAGAERSNDGGGLDERESPFAAEMKTVMDLLGDNLEAKSRLYKDLSLSYIFLMNNGRYMLQKVKGSPEIKEILGNTWCRKRSSELRQYHKSYQRETWGKVLDCLRDEGLQTNKRGSVSKPVLKERFKTFNSTIDDIHRTQRGWVVSDEQLQSELRVSVSAVVVPAYRSFLGRFAQYLDAGRQTEKYIKFGPEELESYIDDLFDGNQSSMVKRRA